MTAVLRSLRHMHWHTMLWAMLAVLASLYLTVPANATASSCLPTGKQAMQADVLLSEPTVCGGCLETGMPKQGHAASTSHCSDWPSCTLYGTVPPATQLAGFAALPQVLPSFAQQHYRSFIPATPQRPPARSRISLACLTAGMAA